MSSARLESLTPEPAHQHIVRRTIEACRLAKEAAAAAAEGIATGSSPLLNSLRQRERELDTLDMEIDSAVTSMITEVEPAEARELLHMATILEKMLTDVGDAFSTRDVGKAVDVLRSDAEIDRLRNLIFLRHIENP